MGRGDRRRQRCGDRDVRQLRDGETGDRRLGGPHDAAALAAAGITHVIDCRDDFDDGPLLAARYHYF